MMMSQCRKLLLEKTCIKSIVPNIPQVFEDASVDSLIFSVAKKNIVCSPIKVLETKNGFFVEKHEVDQANFMNNEKYIFSVEVNSDLQQIMDESKKIQ
jgi:hypothetical protein